MKSPTVVVSLLALAGVAAAAENASAAIADIDISDDLSEAICDQDWYRAIELSSTLITSSNITPEHRQTLLGLRHNFYTYAKGGELKPDEITNCQGIQPSSTKEQIHAYTGPMPRFSSSVAAYVSGRYCYPRELGGDFGDTSYRCSNKTPALAKTTTTVSPYRSSRPANVWTVGARVEGNSIKGTILNNGLTTAKNIILTIRSQRDDQSEAVKTVAIDTLKPWSETDFVATFNHTPGNWLIERIDVN